MINDIERNVLGAILRCEPDQQLEFYSNIGEKYFLDKRNKEIFVAFGTSLLAKKKINALTLLELKANQKLKLTIKEIESFTADINFNFDVYDHIKLLKERYFKTELEKVLDNRINEIKSLKLYDEINPVKDKIITELSGIDIEAESDFINHNENLKRIKDNIKHGKKIEGYSWGIKDLDTITSGIVSPLVYVIGGLKKSGKTRFIIGLRKVLAQQNIIAPFLSLEVPSFEVTKLTISAELEINDLKLRASGLMSNIERELVENNNINFDLFPTECVAGLGLGQVINRIRKYSILFPEQPILIDYIQRIEHNTNKQAQELEHISKSLADAARNYNVPLIILSQMQNIAERESPSIAHLKGSGGIAEAADVIMVIDNIYRRTKNEEKRNIFSLLLEQRYGDSATIEVYGDLSICKFKDLIIEKDDPFA